MTPGKAIRLYCIQCVGGEPHIQDVKQCGGNNVKNGGVKADGHTCLFYRNRMGKGRPSIKLIRTMCLYCQCNSSNQVRDCQEIECSLHAFRFGTNPNISDETREYRRAVFNKSVADGKLERHVKNSEPLFK